MTTTEADALGPLPEPEGWRITDGEGGYHYTDESPDEFQRAWAGRYQRQHEPLFTADQMRAYALQERAAERERCAQYCHEQRMVLRAALTHEDYDTWHEGIADGWGGAAAAIRAGRHNAATSAPPPAPPALP